MKRLKHRGTPIERVTKVKAAVVEHHGYLKVACPGADPISSAVTVRDPGATVQTGLIGPRTQAGSCAGHSRRHRPGIRQVFLTMDTRC
jgi:hypothetical protein